LAAQVAMAYSKQVVCAGFMELAAERWVFIAGVRRLPRNGQAIIFCSCGYHLSSFFFFLAYSQWSEIGMSAILPHMTWP